MAETTKRKDAGVKRVEGNLKTYTVSLNDVRDAHIIEAIEGSDKLRAAAIRELLALGVNAINKGDK